MIPEFVELAVVAVDGYWNSEFALQGRLDLGQGVCRRSRWHNSSIGKPCVGWQRLEQADGLVEEVNYFLCRLIVGVAGCGEGADASSVFAFLMVNCLSKRVIKK